MRIDRKFVVVLGAVIIATVAIGYAATSLTITNSGIVNVSTGANILISTSSIISTTTCSSSTGPYADSGVSISSWSLTVSGPPQTIYACVWNNSSTAKTLTISGAGFPSGVAFSSTGGGVSVTGGGYQLVSFTLTPSSSAATGTFSGATISIT
ncbi:hypothetical protein E6H23_06975 [Candidatus Bathyarchaeota archaeon]|nr:MAG: hypothetical protein E6H23_06975 [Candidatus Bathyarchaeota archaeon]